MYVDETTSTLVPSGKWAGSRGQIVKNLKKLVTYG